MGSSTHRKKRARTGKRASEVTAQGTVLRTKQFSRPDPETKAALHVQECCFVHWDVTGISAVAASLCGDLIAVARTDGTVELRRKEVSWQVFSVRYSSSDNPDVTVSAMCFSNCSRYLFIARLGGSLVVLRVTPEGLADHVCLEPGGGAVWDLAVSRGGPLGRIHIAIACDDGCVRFIAPDPSFSDTTAVDGTGATLTSLPMDSTHYLVTISEATKARALSVAWAPPSPSREADCVACGDSEGGVRWLNPSDGSLYGRGKIPGIRGERTVIWTLVFARGGREVVCGDSRGVATVWSSATNTLNQEVRIEGMKGTLWSSAIVGEGTHSETVFFGCAGGGVGGLQCPTALADDDLWTPLRGCHFHTHDVRTMASFPSGMLVTGSIDARMCLFTLADFVDRKKITWVLPYHGCAGQPPVQFCRRDKLILSRKRKGIDVWSIPEDSRSPSLKLRMNLKSFDSNLIACAISWDCALVAVSSFGTFRLYQVWDKKGSLAETSTFGKVRHLSLEAKTESCLRGVVDMGFCGQLLVCITRCKQRVAVLNNDELLLFDKSVIGSSGISLERVACGCEKVAVSDSKGTVFCASVEAGPSGAKQICPWKTAYTPGEGNSSCVTAMCFSQGDSKLAIATSDFAVLVRKLGDSDEEGWTSCGRYPCMVTSLSFSESGESLLVSGDKFCAVARAAKSSRKRSVSNQRQTAGFEPFLLSAFRDSVLGSSVFGPSKMVVVRRRWDLVQSSLPDAIPTKPFGS